MTEDTKITNNLKSSDSDVDDFAYIASHDLKAPLRGIIQLAHWIEEDVMDIANEDTKENLALLRNRCDRLNRLLDDLLEYSRIGRKDNDIRRINVQHSVENIIDLIDVDNTVTLTCSANLPTFDTYATPLEIVFRNLLSNAIKHHDKAQQSITVQCHVRDDVYEFTVSDDGPGIHPDHHDKIFNLYTTLKPRDEVEGSGMGLSIINKILLNLKQQIIVDSDGKSGSSFRFSWPKKIN